jgi:methyl-accepting chemotaxis protein
MSIRKKLLAGFLLVSLLGMFLGVIGFVSVQKFSSEVAELRTYSDGAHRFSSILNAHYAWRNGMTATIMTGAKFSGSLDPTTCALGKWLSSEDAKNVKDKKIVELLSATTTPHNYIHTGAANIINLLNAGNKDGATVYFTNNILPAFDKVIANLTGIGEWYNELVSEREKEVEEIASKAESIIITFIVIVMVASIILSLYIANIICNPINKLVTLVKEGEKGNMTVRSRLNQKDELGVMAKALDEFFEYLQGILRNLHANSETLASASTELSTVSRELASGSEEVVGQSHTLASTAEEMSVNINAMASGAEEASVNANEVAGAAEQMSTNMNTIASAVEEMSASINQIANNTTEVHKIATEATNKSSEATSVMGKLGAAAKEIGQVTDVIKKIADKTNLLALNATIEAASAGEAGKGFAVVASEIKELANRSAESADDITRRIEGIQNGTGDAVKVIGAVADIIVKINQSVEAIAGHVGQQTKASNEIASNVAQANIGAKRVASAIGEVAKGTLDVSRNAGDAAKGSNNVSQNTIGMSQAAKISAEGATQVSITATDLSKIAVQLSDTVNKFKV